MQSFLYFIGFLLLLGSIATIEFILSPPQIYEGNSFFYQSLSNTNTDTINPDTQKLLTTSLFSTAFKKNNIKVTPVVPSSEINHIFHLFSLSGEKNDFRVFSTTYLSKNTKNENIKYAVVYDIFSTKTRTTTQAYADIKNIVQKALENDVEKSVLDHNKYGQKSFSLKQLEQKGEVMYLVVAHRDRLLGIEYPFSRHEEMEKVFTQLFQTQ